MVLTWGENDIVVVDVDVVVEMNWKHQVTVKYLIQDAPSRKT